MAKYTGLFIGILSILLGISLLFLKSKLKTLFNINQLGKATSDNFLKMEYFVGYYTLVGILLLFGILMIELGFS